MLRRKKILKLKGAPARVKTKKEKKYEEMLNVISKNNLKRQKDKNFLEERRKNWIESYSKRIAGDILNPRSGWLEGNTKKKDIFEPVRLDKLDLEEINAKRKEHNIETPIEKAAVQALEDAKEKAKRVAVICHKSGYQYIGNGEDAKNFGKKTQEMEFK